MRVWTQVSEAPGVVVLPRDSFSFLVDDHFCPLATLGTTGLRPVPDMKGQSLGSAKKEGVLFDAQATQILDPRERLTPPTLCCHQTQRPAEGRMNSPEAHFKLSQSQAWHLASQTSIWARWGPDTFPFSFSCHSRIFPWRSIVLSNSSITELLLLNTIVLQTGDFF